MTKRSILIVPYILLTLCLLGFLLYFLTLRPGGASGNPVVVWMLTAFASGGMIMMAIYGFTLYMFQSREKAALYFSLLCLSASVRFFVLDGNKTIMALIPGFPANIKLFLDYILLAVMIIFLHRLVYEIFIKPKHKRMTLIIDALTLTSFLVIGTINELMGYNNFILRICLFPLSIIVMIYIDVQIYRSPELRKNRLNYLYFISMLIYTAMPVLIAFFINRFPNAPVFSNTFMAIIHVILLSDRYSRTISDNEMLDELNRAKTELFTTISGKMKAPLAIIAKDIQLVDKCIGEKQIDKANELLQQVWQKTMNLSDQISVADSLSIGSLSLDLIANKASCNGRDLAMTQKEFAMLFLLAQNEGKMLTSKYLYEKVWKQPFDDLVNENQLRVHISHLKKKLADSEADIIIETAYGEGYILKRI